MNKHGHNDVQASCTGYDFVVGEIYALRQFSLIGTGPGIGLSGCVYKEPWDTHTEAVCKRTRSITASEYHSLIISGKLKGNIEPTTSWISGIIEYKLPNPCEGLDPTCTCGLYGYHSRSAMTNNSYGNAMLHGVIKAYGKTIIGSKGIRTSKADIVALCPVESTRAHRIKIDGNRSQILNQISLLNGYIKVTREKINNADSYIPAVQKLAPIYHERLEKFSHNLLAIMLFGLVPVLFMVVVEYTSLITLLTYLGIFATVGSFALLQNELGFNAKARMDHIKHKDLLEKELDVLVQEVSVLNNKLQSASRDTWVSVPAEPHVPHHQARSIASRLGVSYYQTMDEMLAAHPLSSAKDWMSPEQLAQYANKELNRWSEAELKKLQAQLANIKWGGFI